MVDEIKIELKTNDYKELDIQEDIDLCVRFIDDFSNIEGIAEKIHYGKIFHRLLSAYAGEYVKSYCNYTDLEQYKIFLPFNYYNMLTVLNTIKIEYNKDNLRRKVFTTENTSLVEKYEDLVKFMDNVNAIPNNKYISFFKECTYNVVPSNRSIYMSFDTLQNQTGFIYEFIRLCDKNMNDFTIFKNDIADKISEIDSLLDRNKTVYSTYVAVFTGLLIAIPNIIGMSL